METDDDTDLDDELDKLVSAPPMPLGSQPVAGPASRDWFVERAKHIPVRLTLGERKYLRLLEAALNVSEYTDRVDIISYGASKAKRIVAQIKELCAIMCGLMTAADYQAGQELVTDRDFQANSEFFQRVFELGRRHKIMNPDKMRTTYGKLIYLLQVHHFHRQRVLIVLMGCQDSQAPEIKDLLSFSCVKPIKTVYSVLDNNEALDLLRDDLVPVATQEIYSEGRSRREVQKDIKSKERAIDSLARRYARDDLTEEDIKQCLYSIGDNNAFLRTNRGERGL
jgi:hypothetical protein